MSKILDTPDAVIDALGGTGATTKLTNRKNPTVVSNWRKRGIPRDVETYLAVTIELKRLGFKASPSVWGMDQPVYRQKRERAL